MAILKNGLQIDNTYGIIDINPIEGTDKISIEFFPNNQTNESFNNGEFSAIFDTKKLLSGGCTSSEILDAFKNSIFDDGENSVGMLDIVKIAVGELKFRLEKERQET